MPVLPYTVRLSQRAKRARMTVKRSGEVVVTVPQRMQNDSRLRSWIIEKMPWAARAVERCKSRSIDPPPMPPYAISKDAAHTFVLERLQVVNAAYSFAYRDVRIKNQRTRWGSCSKLGNLNFSYRLAFLPVHLADYVITHELCHLQEMNHSAKFWDLVKKTIPDHRERRRELREWVA